MRKLDKLNAVQKAFIALSLDIICIISTGLGLYFSNSALLTCIYSVLFFIFGLDIYYAFNFIKNNKK
jgi:hypothetical protein